MQDLDQDFRRAHLGIFQHQLGRIPWDMALERRRVQELDDFSRITFSKLKTSQSPHAENEAKARGASDKTQTQKGSTSELEAGTSELGRTQRCCLRCKNGVKKAKAHLELNLARDVKGSMKGFYMFISSRRQGKKWGKFSPMLNGADRTSVAKDTEEAEILNSFPTSAFSGKTGHLGSLAP